MNSKYFKFKNILVIVLSLLIAACIYPIQLWEYWFKLSFWIHFGLSIFGIALTICSKKIRTGSSLVLVFYVGLAMPLACFVLFSIFNIIPMLTSTNTSYALVLREISQYLITGSFVIAQWASEIIIACFLINFGYWILKKLN